jgi:polyphosphate kinase
MTQTHPFPGEINLRDPQHYFNRDLSWLEFNRRVLHEAQDTRNPLLERVKFAAIFASNLDEFFMVRVAALKQQAIAGLTELTPDGRTPQQQLDEINQSLQPMVMEVQQLVHTDLLPQLATVGVQILQSAELNEGQRSHLKDYFDRRIFPILTPLAVDPGHPFPIMSNLSLNLAVMVHDPETGVANFARVKLPSNLPRFIQLPPELSQVDGKPSVWAGVLLEDVIASNLAALFPGMTIQERHVFRVTRDADLDFDLEEDEADDLLMAIEQELQNRRFGGSVVRLQIPAEMPNAMRQILMQGMKLTPQEVYEMHGLVGLKDLFSFMGLPLPQLKDPGYTPAIPQRLALSDTSIFNVIQQSDLLIHHPYESFTASVERFITEAATDPAVQAIKMTLYRTSSDSPIAKALITAAQNGKQVAVLVELKARFDEASNINWARELERAGVHVVYGFVELKTHTKTVLVVRQEGDELRRYVHIGTGNYNPKTAKLYTDLSLLSCQPELGADLTDLFNYLTGFSKQQAFRKLLVAPTTMRDRMTALIHREMEHACNGNPAWIRAKMNSLVDPQIIYTLYEASQAGVQIDLVIRGICCLRPGIPGVSGNIRIISIVGRFLEHSRIFHFHNNGQEEIYIGSADWMTRNLDRRVEAVTPIEDPQIAAQLKEILTIQLQDNRQAWELQTDGSYTQRQPTESEPERSAQKIFLERAQKSA